ncbi:MAG: hypothetical protein AAFP90_02430 [Planctomycetota bacterium]
MIHRGCELIREEIRHVLTALPEENGVVSVTLFDPRRMPLMDECPNSTPTDHRCPQSDGLNGLNRA